MHSAESLPVMLAPLGFLDLDPPQLIELAASSGFASVGLRTIAAVAGGPEYPLQVGGAQFVATQNALRETGVRVDAIEVVVVTCSLDVLALRPMLEGGQALGAKRVLCNGDDTDLDAVALKFGALCDLAHTFGLDVEMEFMRFRRGVQTLEDAIYVVKKANRLNGFVVLDVLHFFRSGGKLEQLAKIPLHRISSVQLCDGPLQSPPDAELATEARNNRLPLGEGQFPIQELLDALPQEMELGIEIPLPEPRSGQSHRERALLLASTTREFLVANPL